MCVHISLLRTLDENPHIITLTRSLYVDCTSGLIVDMLWGSRMGLTEYWRVMDKDGNGTVDILEFRKGVKETCPEITHGEVVTPFASRALRVYLSVVEFA